MGSEFTMEDFLIILRRRFAYLIIPFLVLVPILSIVVMLLPAKYTSEGIMLIESPQISENLIKGTSSTSALERVEVIRQRIRSRPQLLEIADQTDLFPARLGLSETKKVKRMQKRMKVKPITSEFTTNGANKGAIAFNVGYTDSSPIRATKVANELINRFEREDSRKTVKDAGDTTEFTKAEVDRLTGELKQVQAVIATFKSENDGSLPEQRDIQSQQYQRYIQQMTSLDNQMSSIEEDKRFVESQIASVASGGGSENSPENRLLSLRGSLAELRARYTDSHPEVIALRNEIRALEAQLAPGRELQKLQRDLDVAEEKLAAALRDNADAAAIAKLQEEASRLSDLFIRKATNGSGLSSQAQSYILQSRLVSLQNRTRSVDDQRKDLAKRTEELEARLNRTPAVESQLADLLRDRKFTEDELEKARLRLSSATTSENLQVQGRAERILPIEAASVPEKPSSPNRPALIAVAILFSAMIGVLCAMAFEFMNATIRGRNHLASIIDEPPLAVIPYIQGTEDKAGKLPFIGQLRAPNFGRNSRKRKGSVADDDMGALPAE